MSDKLDQLKSKLREMFQLDRGDLDFGIYRVLNAKRDEVERFLDEDLLPQVRTVLEEYHPAELEETREKLEKAIEGAKAAGVDPEQAPNVKQLREELAQGIDPEKLEEEVYSHLATFFGRYYQGGDFMSLRRYKENVYALPYEGEEVKLHWANADQYYIKSSENLRSYAFNTEHGRVRFELTHAGTERDDIKAAPDKERRFILVEDAPLALEDGDLIVHFEFRSDTGKRKQKDLNAAAVETLLALPAGAPATDTIADWPDWRAALAAKTPTEKNADRTLLEKHLTDYTAKNTFDFFIHKNLGAFLRRELDFFIKNEVMFLDDIENESVPRVEQYLAKIRALRRIAHKIIDFLAQLEDFQKKLWLKKKFVLETNWLVTLDRVPEALYLAIAANDAQRAEWVKLFAIDEIDTDLTGGVAYSEPLTVEFLEANPFLVVDTGFFDRDFKERMLESFEDLDDNAHGLLVNGDNFQSINLLGVRYREQIPCIYIDPPFNTDATPILYKNGYKSSTWSTLVNDRLEAAKPFLQNDGVIVVAIDDEQQRELSFVLSSVFGSNLLGTMCVRSNPSGRPTQTGYSVSHEYLLFAGRSSESKIGRLPPTEQQMARFSQRDEDGVFEWRNLRREGSNSDRNARRALYYPIYITKDSIRVPEMEWNEDTEEWIPREPPEKVEQVVFPDNDDGEQKTWRWEGTKVMNSLSQLAVRKDRSGRDYIYYKRRPHEDGVVSVSSWFDAKYSATEHGTALLKKMFGKAVFSYPKSVFAVRDAIFVAGASGRKACVFDFFAGSGTTGHAVIDLNRSDNGRRKFILAEMGEYFDKVTKARIQKAIYSKDWSEGKPSSGNGVTFVSKYIRLESYEDCLGNLAPKKTDEQTRLVEENDRLREDYMLRYMLDVETRGSLLDLDAFADPFNYRLSVVRDDERKDVVVDLVETFNYLLGLRVRTMRRIEGVYEVFGHNPNGEGVLVLWRNVTEVDNDALDEWFKARDYESRGIDFRLVYVNGDNNLETLRPSDAVWRTGLIEEAFHALMFDTGDP